MRKLTKWVQKNLGMISVISLVLVLSVGATVSALSIPTNQTFTGEIKSLVINNPVGEVIGEVFGGSTSDDWNVGGDLAVTGDSTLTGAITVTGAITGSGAVDVPTFTQGGGITATSTTNATETLLASDFDTENYIDYTANINTTLTLPATSTMSAIVPNAGDMRQVIFRSATTTAATTLTLAAGSGIDLQFVEATGGDLVLNGLDVGVMTFVRKANTDILALWNEYTEAD